MSDPIVEEYNQYYKENPVRWDFIEIDRVRFETVKPRISAYGSPRLLDVGCGSGHTLEYFAEQFPHIEYYGIDLSPVAVKYARTRLPDADIQVASVEDCKLRKMDIILLGGVAEHFVNLSASLAAVHKMLADSGIVYMEVPNCIAYSGAKGEGFYRIREGQQQEWHMTRPQWEQVIIENGFEIMKSIKGPKLHNEFIWILKKSDK